jgi:PiT family inorganic phosphate transporter
MTPLALLLTLILLALVLDFLNGFHDSANVVATIIASRAMTARAALTIAAAAELAGPFLFGVAVAKTVGSEVALPSSITIGVVMAALLAASVWNLATWYFGIPASSSHALIGGIVGAVAAGSGPAAIHASGLWKIAIALFMSPIVGFAVGMIVTKVTFRLARGATPKANEFFKYAQLPTAIALALSHGTNDAQKTMGVITLGLVVLGYQSEFAVPWWVIILSAVAIASGTALGGWRIIHTLGGRFYRIRPIHSFTSQLSSASVILTASLLGGPVSTTQVVSLAILGAGAAQRKSMVRWGVLVDIVVAWLLTVPAAALMAAVIYFAIRPIVE